MGTAERPAGAGRAYLGLALLGWGLSIVVGVTPHEDLWVGLGLAVFGAALLMTAGRLPDVARLSALAVAALGAAIVVTVAGFTAAFQASMDVHKALLAGLGFLLVACAPLLKRSIRIGRKGRRMTVASLVVASLAVVGAPLAAWALQAATKGLVGTTPTEAFVHVALLVPLGLFLDAIGLQPVVHGQTLTYATPQGPLAVEVGAACSGIQAMALFAGVLAMFLWVERPGGRRLALWSVIGIGGVYVANLVRLVAVTLVGYEWGADALARAHAQAGWMFFVAWALLFARLVRQSRPAS